MESETLRSAQVAEQQAWRRWKRQPNPTTYAAYQRASFDTGKAILDLHKAQQPILVIKSKKGYSEGSLEIMSWLGNQTSQCPSQSVAATRVRPRRLPSRPLQRPPKND